MTLMAELAHERYGAQGGDWAAIATAHLGALDATHLVAQPRGGRRPRLLDRGGSAARWGHDRTVGPVRIGEPAEEAATTTQTLVELREAIAVRDDSGPPCTHVAAPLDGPAAELEARTTALGAARAVVQRLRQRASRLDPADCRPDGVCRVIRAR